MALPPAYRAVPIYGGWQLDGGIVPYDLKTRADDLESVFEARQLLAVGVVAEILAQLKKALATNKKAAYLYPERERLLSQKKRS